MEPKKLSEVGEILDVSRERIRRIETKLLSDLGKAITKGTLPRASRTRDRRAPIRAKASGE